MVFLFQYTHTHAPTHVNADNPSTKWLSKRVCYAAALEIVEILVGHTQRFPKRFDRHAAGFMLQAAGPLCQVERLTGKDSTDPPFVLKDAYWSGSLYVSIQNVIKSIKKKKQQLQDVPRFVSSIERARLGYRGIAWQSSSRFCTPQWNEPRSKGGMSGGVALIDLP